MNPGLKSNSNVTFLCASWLALIVLKVLVTECIAIVYHVRVYQTSKENAKQLKIRLVRETLQILAHLMV